MRVQKRGKRVSLEGQTAATFRACICCLRLTGAHALHGIDAGSVHCAPPTLGPSSPTEPSAQGATHEAQLLERKRAPTRHVSSDLQDVLLKSVEYQYQKVLNLIPWNLRESRIPGRDGMYDPHVANADQHHSDGALSGHGATSKLAVGEIIDMGPLPPEVVKLLPCAQAVPTCLYHGV